MISLKVHKSYRNVLAVCDAGLLGKRFEHGNRQLHIKESFYKDQEVDLEQAVMIMKSQALEDATFNIVGHESIKAAKEAGVINPDDIQTLDDIPFILVLL